MAEDTGQPEQPKKGKADHLKQYQFEKGKSGNPGGRPKKIVTDAYKWAFNKKLTDQECVQVGVKRGTTWGQLGALGMMKAIVNGNAQAAKEVADRVEGPVALEISGPEGGAIPLADGTARAQLEEITARLRGRIAQRAQQTIEGEGRIEK